MSFTSRDIRHYIKAGVTLGVDVQNGVARVAFSFLSRTEPNYSRPAAVRLIDLRLDADDSTLKSLGIDRNVYTFPYAGTMPRNEILFPLADALAEEMQRRIASERKPGRVVEMKKIIRSEATERNRASRVQA